MFKRLIPLISFLFISFISFAQLTPMPSGNKIRLIWQTTGDGLVYRGSGVPTYTPTSVNNAWMYLDTLTGQVYFHDDVGGWKNILATLKMPVDSIIFNTTNDGTVGVGELSWNDTDGTLDLGMKGGNVVLQIGQEELHYVRNLTGTPLTVGTVVYINGVSGQRPTVQRAESDTEIGSSITFGVVAEPITSGQSGFVTVSGYIRGVNTGTYTPGQALWLDTIPGKFTNVKPKAPINSVLIGYCITSTTDGTIFVKIQNGYELEELHDVLINNPTNGQTIRYLADSTYWKNDSIVKASDVGIINTVNIANNAVDSTKIVNGGVAYADLSQVVRDSMASYQKKIKLTTNNNSGAATFVNDTLNIPQYSGNTDLSFSGTTSPVKLNSSTGTDVNIKAGSNISLSATTDTITISSTGVSGTAGRVFYADGSGNAVADDTLSWDATNNRLGVNKLSPATTLDVNGNTTITGAASGTALNVKNGSAQDIIIAGTSTTVTPITVTPTTGTYSALGVETSFAPTSGVASFNLISGSPTINQTGGASGVSRGLLLNPTLTAAAGWRTFEWTNNSGFGLYGSGTATNYLAGRLGISNLSPTATLQVTGSGTSTNETFLVENLSGTDNLRVLDNGRIEIGRNTAITTQNTSTIVAAGSDTNIGIALVSKGTGAITAQIPDGTTAGGNARGINAVDFQSLRTAATQVASGAYSAILSGINNTASGNNSFAAGNTCVASGLNSIALGLSSTASSGGGDNSVAIGWGASATARGSYALGRSVTASATESVAIGYGSAAVESFATALGVNARAYMLGQLAVASSDFTIVLSNPTGNAQTSNFRLKAIVSDTITTGLFLVGTSGPILALPSGATSGRVWNARIQIVAVKTSTATGADTIPAGSSLIANYTVGIKRIGNTTSLIGTVQTDHPVQADQYMNTSIITIDADDTNEALRIRWKNPTIAVAATTVRVVATVYLTEVGY